MNLNDAKLERAAKIVAKAELKQWSDFEKYPEPEFSEKFQKEMQALIYDVNANKIKQDKVRMGWQYYSKRGIAAVLLGFLLSCVIMPEAVMAGCQRLIEAVQTVFREYTEYQFDSNVSEEVFVPLRISYMSEPLKETENERHKNRVYVLYEDGDIYFSLNQTILNKENKVNYIVDTEDVAVETIKIQNEEVDFSFRHEVYKFVWIHDIYLVTGQSNLPKESIIKILENIEFEN